MNERSRIALFASGRGTNVEALLKKHRERLEVNRRPHYEVSFVLTDVAGAKVSEVAKKYGFPLIEIEPPKKGTADEKRKAHEEQIVVECKKAKVDWVVLCGYMRVLSPDFIKAFWNEDKKVSQIVNIHPSLLPLFPGLDGYKQAFEAKNPTAGVTVHLVDDKVDHGPICAQKSFDIAACKTFEEVEAKGLKIEHELYDQTLEWLLRGAFRLETKDGRTSVRSH